MPHLWKKERGSGLSKETRHRFEPHRTVPTKGIYSWNSTPRCRLRQQCAVIETNRREKGLLKYVASINRNKNFYYKLLGDSRREKHGIEEIAKKPLTRKVRTGCSPARRTTYSLGIQLNASTFEEATEMDYYLTNEISDLATGRWIAQSYSRRNWVEVFYRESKGWLGITDYEVRDELSMRRHWSIVFVAHSLIQFQQLTGGLRRWATVPLLTFNDALKAYKIAVEFLVVRWISLFPEAFAAHRSSLGYVWR